MYIKDLKKGDIIWECQSGYNIQMKCLEDVRIVHDEGKNGYACNVILKDDSIIELFESFDAGAYSLRLYDSPQYFEIPLKQRKKT